MWFLLLLLLTAASLAFFWIKRRFSYWNDRGVPSLAASFPLGNLQGTGRQHMSVLLQNCYRQLKSAGRKFAGIYFFVNPVVLVLDLDFVKDVLVKDFQFFHDRGIYYNEKDDPLSVNLLSVEGSKWKHLRSKLTPTFTSGKMKMMFSTITAVAEQMQTHLAKEIRGKDAIEMRDFVARFTTDVIGSCAFGLECNSLDDPETMFRQMGRKAFTQTPLTFLKVMIGLIFRDLARKMKVRLIPKDVSDFFLGVVRNTIEYRENNKVTRNDFMDLLIKIKNAQPVEEGSESNQLGPMTFNEITAQAFLFFIAGFETSSTTMTYCMYELALNQDIQDKLRQHIKDIVKQHGSMTYEAIQDMKYLECCIHEALRKYPPIVTLFRDITADYKIPGNGGITLQKGGRVAIPVYAIHHDADYYPDPERYDPDRFTPDKVAERHPMSFLPFGEGPRNCIGLRFGMLQTKVGLAYLLQKFRLKLSPKTSSPLKILPSNIIMTIDGGLWLEVEEIKQ